MICKKKIYLPDTYDSLFQNPCMLNYSIVHVDDDGC